VGLAPKRGCPLTLAYYAFQMIWFWRATVEWYWQEKTEELGEKPVPVPICPPQIPHALNRARTRASAVRGRRLTTWSMARPYNSNTSETPLLLIVQCLPFPNQSLVLRKFVVKNHDAFSEIESRTVTGQGAVVSRLGSLSFAATSNRPATTTAPLKWSMSRSSLQKMRWINSLKTKLV
jgi:hypothetical protein